MKKDIYRTIKKVVFLYLLLLLILFPEAGFAGKDVWTFTGDLSLQATETIRSIVINPIDSTIIYAGNDTSVIFKSTNGGLSWSSLNGIRFDIEGTSSNKRIIDIIIDPNYPDTLLAASDSGGVYRTYNGGTTWSKVGKPSAGLNDTIISALAMNSNNSDIIYASTDSGVYKSEDKGTTWYTVNNGLQQDTVNILTLAIDPVNSLNLYVGTSTGKIYRTQNGGGSWSVASTISGSPVITKITVDPKSPTKIYVGTQSNAFYYSSNRGLTFTQVADGLPTAPYPNITSIAIDTSTTTKIYIGTEYRGIYKKLESDSTWTAVNTGLTIPTVIVQTLAINPTKPIEIYAGTQGEGIFVYTGNRAPIMEDIPNKRITAGNTLYIDVIASDPDSGETAFLVYSIIPETLAANQSFDHLYSRRFTWTPDTSQAGNDTIIFIVRDQRGGEDRDTVIINVNKDPVLTAIGSKQVNEADSLRITLSATDPDGDSVGYSVSTLYPTGEVKTLPPGASFTSAGVFRWVPGYDIASRTQGSVKYYVTFTAVDSMDGSDSETVEIKVIHVNRAPQFTSIPDSRSVNEGQALEFEVLAQDLDLDEIEYHTIGLASMPGASFDSLSSHKFSWIPAFGDSGSYSIIFIILDEKGATVRDTVSIHVNDMNRLPQITNISDTTMYVNIGDSLKFTIIASDPDGDSLVYNATGLKEGATYNIYTHKFRWIPTITQGGPYQLRFNVEDTRGGAYFVNVTIIVNNRPRFVSYADTSVFENDSLYFSLSAVDLNNDTLLYSAVGLPSGASVTATLSNITFGWRPGYNASGSYAVKFIVNDRKTGYDTAAVQVNVNNVNQPPVMNAIGTKAVNIGHNLQFVVRASDADNESLTYSALNLPSNASFSTEQVFSWTPQSTQIDTFYVTFKVQDILGGQDSTIVMILVTDENFPPDFTNHVIEDKSVNENEELIFAVVANDPNQDTLTYSVLGTLPDGAVFNATATPAPYFQWTPDYTQSGDYSVSFTSADPEGGKDTVAVAINVVNINRLPVLTATSDTSINEEQHLLLLVSVSDADNDSVTVIAEELPEGATFVPDNSVYKFDWTPTQMQQGNFDVRFIAVDTLGGADTVITTITVEYVNIAPLLPAIVFPKTGEEIKTSSYFVWERSYDQNPRDTVFYRMEIDDSPDFTSPVLVNEKISPVVTMGKNADKPGILFKHSKTEDGKSVETVSIRLDEISGYSLLVDDVTYFWRVKAFDNGGQSSSFTSGQDSFAVNLANDTPGPISAGISPSGGKTVIDENPEISWYPAFDPDKSDHAANLRYWIQLSMDSTFAADIFYQDTSDVGINSITVAAALEDEKAWFFRVRTIDDENAISDWSEVQKFYVNTKNNPPEPFGLVMPLDKAVFNPMPEGIVLTWQLSSDTDPLSKISYSVEIATDTSFSAASIIFSESDLPQDSNSVYIATSTFEADEYYWRIIAKDNDDLITISDEKRSFLLGISTGIDDETETIELPKSYNLYQNYPNPFNGETIIRFAMPRQTHVTIKVFDLLGREVVTLLDSQQAPGRYAITWDGKDTFGRDVASGVYIYTISARNFSSTKRMVYLK